MLSPGTPQRLRIARAALAEAEIVADHHVGHAERPHQHPVDEVVGRQPRQGGVEAHHHRHVQPQPFQQRQLAGQRRQTKVWLVRLEDLARVRLEQNDAGRPVLPLRLGKGCSNKRLMAPVHPIEVADRQRATPGGRRNVIGAVHNDHCWSGWSGAPYRGGKRFRLPHVAARMVLGPKRQFCSSPIL
jgi:hypothetical protein